MDQSIYPEYSLPPPADTRCGTVPHAGTQCAAYVRSLTLTVRELNGRNCLRIDDARLARRDRVPLLKESFVPLRVIRLDRIGLRNAFESINYTKLPTEERRLRSSPTQFN
jgi:hypothetical protein